MKIQILELLEGAKKATGMTVIIDVFRAFSLEAYFYAQGADLIIPVDQEKTARALKQAHPEYLLCGERKGAKLEGFDYGNSPSAILGKSFEGSTIVHTTSAGTQGIYAAKDATEILTGSFVNAKAIAEYIKRKNPDNVTLVPLGTYATESSEEDVLCAQYIESLLKDQPLPNIERLVQDLKYTAGKKFFDPAYIHFPEDDFECCIALNQFPFVIQVIQENGLYYGKKVEVSYESKSILL